MKTKRTGTFLGMPYDWRRPTLRRLRNEVFNLDEPRLFVPKAYGWGYGINFGAPIALWRRRRRA
ncbi:MAG: hypothetical protein QOG94_1423 [Solirubrobacteraceae bacterium]|jgi:hypothetical protein|nr:hypothetical protein [Solirubrobacteraceae bacterium]MEA2137994.1 hypothetical protein [Solirubrobacteraceae bacterium]